MMLNWNLNVMILETLKKVEGLLMKSVLFHKQLSFQKSDLYASDTET